MSELEPVVGSGLFDPSEDALGDVEGLCLQSMQMSRENFPERWRERLDYTHGEASAHFACKAMFESFPLEKVDGPRVCLRTGDVLENALLAEAFAGAGELVVFAATVHGFEELCGTAVNSGMMLSLYGGWGAAFSMGSRKWVQDEVRDRALAHGMRAGKTWFPGEEGLEMSLLGPIAGLIDLSQIGLEVKVDYIMHPTMSVMGFIPIFPDSGIDRA